MTAARRPAGRIRSFGSALIVDDHPLFCEALALTLRSFLDIPTIAAADRLETAIQMLSDGSRPDIVLLDLSLPDVEGVDGLIRMKREAGSTPVVVVSSLSEPRVIRSVINAGAAGFVPKHSQRDVFKNAFETIGRGGLFVPECDLQLDDGEAAESIESEALRRLSELTLQQSRILRLVCDGKPNKQIAFDLGIAETTVKAHITAILRKLGVQSRTQAVLMAQNAKFSNILYGSADIV